MLCRFCEHSFEGGGREFVPEILKHVAENHAIDLMNLCVRLPFEPMGGHKTELAYEETNKGKIRQRRLRSETYSEAIARIMGESITQARPNGGEFVPEDQDFPEYLEESEQQSFDDYEADIRGRY